MTICYARTSQPSAMRLSEQGFDTQIVRSSHGDINWGRAQAHTLLNPNISNSTNKRIMRQLFAEHSVPAPQLWNRREAPRFPLVGRPDRHTGGRGFWLIHTERDLTRALRGTRRKRAATHFMEFIPKEIAPREYRVHIFRGKSIRISEKLFGSVGTSSHGSYTTIKPQHPVRHVRKAAKQAMEAVGLDFGAVDILANDTECWVTEVNAAPGIGGSLPRLYTEMFQRYLEGEWHD